MKDEWGAAATALLSSFILLLSVPVPLAQGRQAERGERDSQAVGPVHLPRLGPPSGQGVALVEEDERQRDEREAKPGQPPSHRTHPSFPLVSGFSTIRPSPRPPVD